MRKKMEVERDYPKSGKALANGYLFHNITTRKAQRAQREVDPRSPPLPHIGRAWPRPQGAEDAYLREGEHYGQCANASRNLTSLEARPQPS